MAMALHVDRTAATLHMIAEPAAPRATLKLT